MRRILIVAFILLISFFIYYAPKAAFAAALTDPGGCSLDSLTVNGQTYSPSTPIPEFQNFFLNMSCVSNDPNNRGQVDATLFATVNGQQNNALLSSGAGQATASVGPYNGLSGQSSTQIGPGVIYTITTQYASLNTGNGLQTVTCSIGLAPCTFLVTGNGATPTPTPIGGASCPAFKGFNPDPPVVNQSFQLQYNVPSNPDLGLTYQFQWTEKDGTKGTTSLNETTAAAYGVWVGTFTFNQETTITLGFLGYQGQWSPLCDSHTVFSGITASPPPKGSSGKNPCTGGTCQTAIGNIPTNLGDFATAFLRIALGIAGGIVLILMVIGSIRVMTSSGDPQRVAAGRDMIVAALAGALFIAFSVMIMQFFGTAIVPIPGLTFGT